MNKNKLIKKIILFRILKNNISGNIYYNYKEEIEKIKNTIIKVKNVDTLEQTHIKENQPIKSLEHNTKQTNTKNLLIIYIDKKHLNKNTNAIIKKWCESISILNYKIINNSNTLIAEIDNQQPKAILACEEVELFLNQNLRIQIVRGFELKFKKIPIVFTHLPTSQISNPELKKEIWQDLKMIKGIVKYG
ncbi:hypothetical protein [Borrelia crocidurae]|uniref:Uncharacterized protein n=2 Tax=Borrelia crocidurae TaxID=29520 RepID=W5SGN8_9SPIR|nr:hypothetical protein [Borrelia crocidurae]AFI30798.1 hypothetical protein Q7M_19 [Borrelia crocidurae str. Achema]AHH06082.1 Hypothetical protein BCD_0016 [Borrelia crocidurae DOU]